MLHLKIRHTREKQNKCMYYQQNTLTETEQKLDHFDLLSRYVDDDDQHPSQMPVTKKKFIFLVFEQNISNVRNTWEEIKNEVKVTPTMVFSVIGDSDSFVPRPWPRTVFQTALIDAAKCGGGM